MIEVYRVLRANASCPWYEPYATNTNSYFLQFDNPATDTDIARYEPDHDVDYGTYIQIGSGTAYRCVIGYHTNVARL